MRTILVLAGLFGTDESITSALNIGHGILKVYALSVVCGNPLQTDVVVWELQR